MSTLLLRLVAPLQSWGSDSKFDRRNTWRSPSKSGVVGLCAAALGIRRDDKERIKELAMLKFGVRIDRPGKLIKDFHMAHYEAFWDMGDRSRINRGAKSGSAYLTNRYYLSDAAFLAGFEGNEGLLEEIDAAIRAPMFPLFLGRRSCPPEGQVALGIKPIGLRKALETEPSVALIRKTASYGVDEPRVIVMDSDSDGNYQRDLPVSFSTERRVFDSRRVNEFDIPALNQTVEELFDSEHDALAELEAPL
jgi:CRISPR system Cascade subunit CasD